MNQTLDLKTDFLEELDLLYVEVRRWLKDSRIGLWNGEVSIEEEQNGRYTAKSLLLAERNGSAQGPRIAELVPIGASILGARGRVDLKGRYGSEIFSLLEEGGPSISTRIVGVGTPSAERSHPLYKGVTEAGWYWIESRSLGRAHRLTPDIFFQLLKRVSSYAIGE